MLNTLNIFLIGDFTLTNLIDILCLSGLIVLLFLSTRKTKGFNVLMLLGAVYGIWKLAQYLNLVYFAELLSYLIIVGLIGLVIIFQKELKEYLLKLTVSINRNTSSTLFNRLSKNENSIKTDSSEIKQALINLSKTKTGALIILTQKNDPAHYCSSETLIDSKLKTILLETIFQKESPLHDGAVLIRNNRIESAGNVIPVSNKDIAKSYGTRHRAALGLSEMCDAKIYIVSEETGKISLAKNGKIKVLNFDSLR